MNDIFSAYGGVWLIGFFMLFFLAFNYSLSWIFARKYTNTKSRFLVADRELGVWQSSLSIGASYVWAPAMFISAFKAYDQGWVGLFYFIAGNLTALLIYSLLVNRICEKWPQGFTLSDFMGVQHSHRVRVVYWVSLIGLTIGAFATQLLAGANFIKLLTGMDYLLATVLLALVPLIYSWWFGFKSSVITDLAKMLILLVIGIGLTLAIVSQVGIDTVIAGTAGITGGFVSLFDANGWLVFSTFGLATLIGLISGPFGDQALWQRAFATPDSKTRRRSFLIGTGFYLVVPICMGIIGFAAAGYGFRSDSPTFINLMFIIDQLPLWAVMLFAIMILSGITSILDSKLSAMSSIAGHDIAARLYKTPTDQQSIKIGKISMIALAVISILIANIPGLTLVHLFLIYGSLRASTMLPTLIVMLTSRPLAESGVFYGSLGSLLVGVPLLIYGTLTVSPVFTIAGSVSALVISGAVALCWTWYQRSQGKNFDFVPDNVSRNT